MKRLFLKDSSFTHCLFSNNPMPPKTFTEDIVWDRKNEGPIKDTVYTDFHIQECDGGIGWLLEPRELIPHAYEFVKNNIHKFSQVWSHDEEFLNSLPSYKPSVVKHFIPFGGCWIDKKDYKIHEKHKDCMISIIASGKRQLPGHNLRHQIIDGSGKNITVYGNGYFPIKDKIQGLEKWHYHFAVENVKKDCWFTEKLIDCFVTGTIPIYWGCPSIGHYFATDGMIIFDTLPELKEKLKLCTPEYYESKREAIEHNFKTAQKYVLAENTIYDKFYKDALDIP